MFSLTDIPLTKYLTNFQKRHLDSVYNNHIANGKKINCRSISKEINEPACVVKLYYIEKYRDEVISKFNSDEIHIYYKEGYMMFSGYGYKRGQYIMSKELGVDIKTITKFIVHHHDDDKMNDNLWNLLLMYNRKHHKHIHNGKYVVLKDVIHLARKCLAYELRWWKGMTKAGHYDKKDFDYEDDKIDKYIILFNRLYEKIEYSDTWNKLSR